MKRIYLVILIAFIASSLIACSIKSSNQLPTKSVSSKTTLSSQKQTSSTDSSIEIISSSTEKIECEVPLPPVSKELQELYLKGLEAYWWFHVSTLSGDGDSIIKGDNTYFEVIDPRFPTYKSWNNYLLSIFKKNYIDEKLFNKKLGNDKYYTNIDGKLYGIQADRGTDIYYTSHEFKMDNQNDNMIKVKIICHYDESGKNNKNGGKYAKEFPLVFEKIEGEWRISVFEFWA